MPGGKERLFFTGSARIIGDPRPSGLDMRVYACVSLHDGMSLVKKTGRGCYATFATLTAAVGCDAANLSRSLKRLVEWGYLTEERQDDRRRKTYRVTFETVESWQNCQQSNVGETANEAAEIVGNGESGNGSNLPQDEQHYSSLKGLNPSEEEKLDSPEGARFAARQALQVMRGPTVGAELAKLERALKRHPETVDKMGWITWLESHAMEADTSADRGRANRLHEQLVESLDEQSYAQWADGIRAAANG